MTKPGTLIELNDGTQAIHLYSQKSGSSSTVYVTECPSHPEDKYYTGKQTWACKTEVKVVKNE